MNREWGKHQKIDRKSWAPGPWDSEPDFYEWTTQVGYPAWAARLQSGSWFLVIEAPYPHKEDGAFRMGFHHCIRDKSEGRIELEPGSCFSTDKEDILGFVSSLEHWESPGPSDRTWWRGPYKTLEDVKKIGEKLASNILEVHQEEKYKRYFEIKE